MTRSTGLRGRLSAVALLLALLASLVPAASVYAVAISPATGGGAISVDQFGTSNYTTLSGPAIAEQAVGFLGLGTTTILNAPAGFRFNAGIGNTSSSGAGCNLAGTLSVTASQATFTVTTASTVNTCILTFVGLQVQPTSGNVPVSGNITKTGTSAAPGGATNYGTLTRVAGAVTQLIYLTQPSANSNGGAAFAQQPRILARDQFSNNVPNAPITLAITPGTGAAGATLTCNTNPLPTSAAGDANFAGQACRIDKAGNYTLRASNGSVFADSGVFVINVGPATKLVFTSYPAATTPTTLAPQPAVAIADAGGNTVTTFPATNITLAINQNGGTFSCNGGLTAATVSGVATFTGCTQSTPGSGYTLTATVGFAMVVGTAFAVSPPVLAFIAGPGSPTAGQPFPTNVQVAIQNGGVTLTSGIAATLQLSIGTNPSAGTLACTGGTSATTVSGVATFTGCSINNPGNGYTLVATPTLVAPPTTLNPATSAPFNVGANISPAVISITTFCGQPTPKSTTGPNTCAPDTTKSPPQANIKLPQNLNEGVYIVATIAGNGANRTVTFQVSKDQTTWSDINTTTTDAGGNAMFFYRPSDNRYYRVSFAGAADLGAAISPTVRVVVRSLIFLRPTGCTSSDPCRTPTGSTVLFTAIARPNRPELPQQQVQFTVQRRSGGTYVNVLTQIVNVGASGEAQLNVTFNSAGTYRLRANLLPTSVNANSFPTEFEYYRVP